MIYLNVLDGAQAGNYSEILPDIELSIANSFGSDIYLLLPSWSDFEARFILKNNLIQILNTNQEFLINQRPVDIGMVYELPAIWELDGVHLGLSADLHCQLEDFKYLQYPEDNINNLFDVGLSVDEPNLDELNQIGATPSMHHKLPNKFIVKISSLYLKFMNSSLGLLLVSCGMQFKKSKAYAQLVLLALKLKLFLKELVQRLFKKVGYWTYLIISAAVIGFVVVIIVVYQVHKSNIVEQNIVERKSTKLILEQQLLKLPNRYSNLKIVASGTGYALSGVVENTNDIVKVKQIFSKFSRGLDFNLLTFNQVYQPILASLQQHKILRASVNFESNSGTLSINGLTDNMEVIDDAEISIANQFPNAGRLDSSGVYLKSDVDNALDILISAKYKQLVTVSKNYESGIISLDGFLSAAEISDINTGIDQFNQKYNPVIKLVTNIQDSVKALPFGISEVFTGSPAWLVTDDGQRIYVGGSYKGILVSSIDNDKVIFKGKFTLTLGLNQLLPLGSTSPPVGISSGSAETGRIQILDEEKASESSTINREKSQLKSLQIIIDKSNDTELKSALEETIANIQDDLTYREKSYQYYFKEKL